MANITRIPEGMCTCQLCHGHYISKEVPKPMFYSRSSERKTLPYTCYQICPGCWVDQGPRMAEVVGDLQNAFAKCTKYNLTFKRYCQMLKDQDYSCARCKIRFSRFSPKDRCSASIDHDHGCCDRNSSCGKCVRGIVCENCNLLMTVKWCLKFPDDPYLRSYANKLDEIPLAV